MADRIKELANLVLKDSFVADIGTDHAYLLVELFKNNKIKFAYAIDNKDGPINNAYVNLKKNNLLNNCKVIKTDGLNFQFDKKLNTLIFAGLGGYTISTILNDNIKKLKQIKYIITDIHKNESVVISILNNLNYKIDKEINIIDKNKKYHLMRFIYESK